MAHILFIISWHMFIQRCRRMEFLLLRLSQIFPRLILNIASNAKLLTYETEICGHMLAFTIFVGNPQSAPLRTVHTVGQNLIPL